MGFKSLALLAAIGVTAGVTASVIQSNANIKLNELKGQNTELTTQLENEKTEKQQYYEALVESAKTLEAKEILIENLTLDLTAVQNSLSITTSNLTLTQTELNNKIVLLEESEANILNLQSLIESANEHKTELMLEIESANATIQNLEQELTTANSDKTLIQEQLTAANLNVQNLTAELATVTANNATLQAELDNALAGKAELETNVATLTAERDSLQLQINSLAEENNVLNNTILELREQVNSSVNLPLVTTSVSDFKIENGAITKYVGNSQNVIVPISYSIEEIQVSVVIPDIASSNSRMEEFNGYAASEFTLKSYVTNEEIYINLLSLTEADYVNMMNLLDDETKYPLEISANLSKVVDGADYLITSIGYYAFGECYDLTSVTMLNNITSIAESAFSQCYALETVVLPSSVTELSQRVFHSCTNLKTIILSETIAKIGIGAISNCLKLKEVIILATTPPELILDYVYNLDPFYSSPITTIYIPAGTKAAYESAEVWKDLSVEFIELQ